MGSFGGNKSGSSGVNASTQQSSAAGGSTSYGQSSNVSQAGQSVYAPQAGALDALYGGVQATLGQQPGANVAPAAQQSWLAALAPGLSPQFQASLDATLGSIGRNFSESVLPGLRSDAVGAGAYGTPRAQLAEGVAAGEVGRQMATTAAQLTADQYRTDQAGRLQALALAPQMAGLQFAPLTAAREAMGGPLVLGSSSSAGQSTQNAQSWNTAQSSGASFGNQQGRTQGFNMGVGEK
jgi:hypothetical protein